MYDRETVIKGATEYFNNEMSGDIWSNKYCLGDNEGNYLEKSPDDNLRRFATEIARIEAKKFKNPLSFDQVYDLVKDFKYIVPQGSPLAGVGNYNQFVSIANCFVIKPPEDSYGGILRADQEIVQISKRRGGVGTDISHIRPKGMQTKNSSRTSTGILPFMERFSNSIREVGQEGRRGALMLTISVHHPQILDFVTVKNDETKVTGANISVRITDEFLRAVEKDELYEQRYPVEPDAERKFSRLVSAREVWDAIVHNAWLRAEPGILFWDAIIRESPADCYGVYGYRTLSTNPCLLSTVVLDTKNGPVRIKDIRVGDQIASPEGWTTVIAKWSTGVNPVYVYGTSEASLYCTKNHRIVSNGEEINAEDAEFLDVVDEDGIVQPEKIIFRKYCGEEETWDITVDNRSHSFYANDCVVKNCGEIPLSEDACRLLILNLFSYVRYPYTDKATFDFALFAEHAKLAQRFQDNIVDLELEHIERILKKIEEDPEDEPTKEVERKLWQRMYKSCGEGRRTGTGISALGDTLAALGVPYGSKRGIEVATQIYKTLKLSCYRSSVDMAKELGPFPIWDHELEKHNPFLLRIADEDPALYQDMIHYGRRNIALLTTAPVGTLSNLLKLIVLFGTTSGIEPMFTDKSYKRRRKINPNDKNARVDFTDAMGDKWQEYDVYPAGVQEWMRVTGNDDYTLSPYHGCTANDLDWKQRVELQAAIQKHIDHSISSTVNLPNDVSKEKVAEIYETAWRAGCKGMTVYRDGCRTGVLIHKEEKAKDNTITKNQAPKRPTKLPCKLHNINVKGFKYNVIVGMMGEDPYEVYAIARESYLPLKDGFVVKKKRGHYQLQDEDGEIILENICEGINHEEEVTCRLLSTSLRHGADLSFIVHQIEKTEGDLFNFAKSIARALKKHLKDGTMVSGETCPGCGQDSLRRTEGCISCPCGFSKC